LFEVLNRPEEHWAEQPCIAAHGIADMLRQVLMVIVTLDKARLPWALELLEYVRQHVGAAAIIGTTPGDTRH
jgi:hypothetical protein